MKGQTETMLALGLLMGLGGCSNALAPSFEAVGVREVERDADRSVLEFSVRATNPNPDPIPLRSWKFLLKMAGWLGGVEWVWV